MGEVVVDGLRRDLRGEAVSDEVRRLADEKMKVRCESEIARPCVVSCSKAGKSSEKRKTEVPSLMPSESVSPTDRYSHVSSLMPIDRHLGCPL